jgi:hypothetical protein
MSLRKLPRAIFGFGLQPALPTRQELARVLEQGLSKRFGPVQVRYPIIQRLYRESMLIVNVGGKEVLVSLLRDGSRRELPEYQKEWMVLVDPFSGPVWRVLRHGSESGYESEFLAISNVVHALLGEVPRIKGLRWYFKGWDPKKPAVRTPSELPWCMNDAELDGAESPKAS